MKHPPSPCIGLCQITPRTGCCAGCWRTLDEIAAWPRLTAQGKHAVLKAITKRQVDC